MSHEYPKIISGHPLIHPPPLSQPTSENSASFLRCLRPLHHHTSSSPIRIIVTTVIPPFALNPGEGLVEAPSSGHVRKMIPITNRTPTSISIATYNHRSRIPPVSTSNNHWASDDRSVAERRISQPPITLGAVDVYLDIGRRTTTRSTASSVVDKSGVRGLAIGGVGVGVGLCHGWLGGEETVPVDEAGAGAAGAGAEGTSGAEHLDAWVIGGRLRGWLRC